MIPQNCHHPCMRVVHGHMSMCTATSTCSLPSPRLYLPVLRPISLDEGFVLHSLLRIVPAEVRFFSGLPHPTVLRLTIGATKLQRCSQRNHGALRHNLPRAPRRSVGLRLRRWGSRAAAARLMERSDQPSLRSQWTFASRRLASGPRGVTRGCVCCCACAGSRVFQEL